MAIYENMAIKGRGGGAPTYSSKVQNHAPGQGVSARLSDNAIQIVASADKNRNNELIKLGRAITSAAKAGLDAYDEYSKSKATQLFTEYRRGMNNALYGEGGLLNTVGEDSFNAEERRKVTSDIFRKQLLDGANERTQYYFNNRADDYDADTSLKTQKYVRGQRLDWMNRNDQAAAEDFAESAAISFRNEEDFYKNIGQSLWHVEQLLRRQGYSGEALARGLKEASSKIFMSAIQQGLTNDNPDSAEKLLQHGEKNIRLGEQEDKPGNPTDVAHKWMTDTDVAKARTLIDNKREVMKAKAEAEAKRKAEEWKRQKITNSANEILKEVREFATQEEQNAALVKFTENMDPEECNAIRKWVLASLKEEKAQHEADIILEAGRISKEIDANGYTPLGAKAFIEISNASPEAKAYLLQELQDKVDNKSNEAESSEKATELRIAWDMGMFSGPNARNHMLVKAKKIGVNSKDLAALAEYAGKPQVYSQYRINGLVESVLGKNTDLSVKGGIYRALIEYDPDIQAGRDLTDKQLKEKIYMLNQYGTDASDTSWFRKSLPEYEIQNAGKGLFFRPNLTDEQRKMVQARLANKPAYQHANQKARDLMEKLHYRVVFQGKAYKLTDDEKKILGVKDNDN